MTAEELAIASLRDFDDAGRGYVPRRWQNRTRGAGTRELADELRSGLRAIDFWETASRWAAETGRPRREWYSRRLMIAPLFRPSMAELRGNARYWFGIELKSGAELRSFVRELETDPEVRT